MENSLGQLFTITSFGESHGSVVGVIIDGCPAGLPITEGDIQTEVTELRGDIEKLDTKIDLNQKEILRAIRER